MDKMLVAVFNDEKQAYEGRRALGDLDADGAITVYSTAVIVKDAKRGISVKQSADQGPLGTAVGLFTGSLLGLLAGPAGFAIAAGAGTLGGLVYDLAKLGVNDDFLREVGEQLGPGKVAVVAEVFEEWVTPVDSRLEALGGVVFRRARGEVLDAQIERDITALKSEVLGLKAEWTNAAATERARLDKRLDDAKKKLKAAQDRARAAIDATEKEAASRLKTLEAKAAKAQGAAKEKIEHRVAEARADYHQRSEKLRQAWELAAQALT
jgi:uncharacterized membrane protein